MKIDVGTINVPLFQLPLRLRRFHNSPFPAVAILAGRIYTECRRRQRTFSRLRPLYRGARIAAKGLILSHARTARLSVRVSRAIARVYTPAKPCKRTHVRAHRHVPVYARASCFMCARVYPRALVHHPSASCLSNSILSTSQSSLSFPLSPCARALIAG